MLSQLLYVESGIVAYMKERLGHAHDFLGFFNLFLKLFDIFPDGGKGLGLKHF